MPPPAVERQPTKRPMPGVSEPGAPAALYGAPTGFVQRRARHPASVEKYLASKFGDHLKEARAAMAELVGHT